MSIRTSRKATSTRSGRTTRSRRPTRSGRTTRSRRPTRSGRGTKTITLSQLPAELKKMERNGERPRTPKPTKNNPFGYVDVLKKEYKTFGKRLNYFMRKHKGKYVLIKGDEVEGFYTERKKAVLVGIAKYGETGSFLVKLITRKKPEPIFMPSVFMPRTIDI